MPNDADANNRATQTDLIMEFAAPSFAKGGVAQRGGKRLELRPPPNARLREGWLAPLLDKILSIATHSHSFKKAYMIMQTITRGVQ